MNCHDRARIDECVNDMMAILDMTILWPLLLENGIYNRDDVNIPVWEKSLNERTTTKDILLTIKTRGPHAYQKLIQCLRKANYIKLVTMLQNSSLPFTNNNSSEMRDRRNGFDRPDNNAVDLYDPSKADGPVKVLVCRADKFLDRSGNLLIDRYPMRSKVRGLVLIITLINYKGNSNRDAAEHDEKNLKELYEQMGFKVDSRKNLTVSEIRDTMREFANNKQFREVDSCFVIMSGHGTRSSLECQTVIIDKHDEEITVGEILSYFTAEKCVNLIHKPKVFIFQMCRGAIHQHSVSTDNNTNENSKFVFKFDDEEAQSEIPGAKKYVSSPRHVPKDMSVRNYDDILVAHSTIPGHVSYRDRETGTWYIQILCDVFMKNAFNTHIQDLFLMVDRRMQDLRDSAQHCQTSTVKTIGFNKHLYLNPGLNE